MDEASIRSVIGAVQRDNPDTLLEVLRQGKTYAHDDLARGLHIAANKGHLECLQLLLDFKALPNIHDINGFTPLIIAAQHGHTNIVKALIKANCSVDKPTFRVRATALHWAATNGHYDTVQALLDAGANTESQTVHGRSPLILAARSGYEDIIRLLIRVGVNIDRPDLDRCTALHMAAEEGSHDGVDILLRAGAKINCRTKYGDTPLMLAARRGHTAVVQMLLRRADIDLKSRSRQMTVLHWAAEGGHPECVKLLLQYHIDPNVTTNDCYSGAEFLVNSGATPLMLACHGGYSDVAKILLSHGAIPDIIDAEGLTPMLYSVKHDHYNCTDVLLQYGASVDGILLGTYSEYAVQDKMSSPLLTAVERNSVGCVKTLLRANCDLSVIGLSKSGPVTAFELALLKGHLDICRMILLTGHRVSLAQLPALEQALAELLQGEEELFQQLMRQMSTPPLLMQACRRQIRQCVGPRVSMSLGKLPLPESLLKYLTLEELDDF